MQYLVGIDIGGTCTDCVVIDENGKATLGKAFSTPPDFSAGILNALEVAAQSLGVTSADILTNTRLFLHSGTVAENAVVDGNLAPAGLITTRGFQHTLFATRGGYGRWSGLSEDEKRNPIDTEKAPPIIPISRIRAVRERTDYKGAVLAEVNGEEVSAAVMNLVAEGVESIGISLLWSFVNPRNEQVVREIVQRMRPDLFVTASSEIAPILGEYERTSTVALNASLGPVVSRYLTNLVEGLRKLGFRGSLLVMQAYGGLLPLKEATVRPVGMVESGPVSGLMGSKRLGDLIGFHNIISADMGGTTFKIGTVREGLIEYQRESMVLRYHYALPKMDVVSLGLAGGSIISVEPRLKLPRVGPRSAGSYPGPVCYDHGGDEPTLTDVDAILGYLNSNYFLGGRARLNLDKAQQVFEERIAGPLGMPVVDAAAAIYKLANSMIYDLVHKTTVQRGLDPREFSLFSTGGTAGMHLGTVGEELSVSQVIVPHSASVHGAFGLVTSDIVHEALTTRPMRHPADPAAVATLFEGLVDRTITQLRREGFADEEMEIVRAIDMRYRRQVHIITVPVELDRSRGQPAPITAEVLNVTVDRFETLYKQKYGPESTFREAGIELVSFRVRASGLVKKPAFPMAELGDPDPRHAAVETRRVYVADTNEMANVTGYDFERLQPGNVIPGPAIIWTPITTVVLNSRQVATCDALKNLVIRGRQRR
jgi:N-methylhydantoinase A